ncbi:unnamed protein product [Paramecium sonneborni]|uniref:Uncharacterized protein n=1 Tax=Paramecium sonneborni TaxID=65129 RepID=A0A8S1P8S5_9CILI|nr:unnamed protein product [Paramecium sonneborni]
MIQIPNLQFSNYNNLLKSPYFLSDLIPLWTGGETFMEMRFQIRCNSTQVENYRKDQLMGVRLIAQNTLTQRKRNYLIEFQPNQLQAQVFGYHEDDELTVSNLLLYFSLLKKSSLTIGLKQKSMLISIYSYLILKLQQQIQMYTNKYKIVLIKLTIDNGRNLHDKNCQYNNSKFIILF